MVLDLIPVIRFTSLPDGSMGKNVMPLNVIFGGDISSSVHTDNKGENILILGEGPTQRLDDTALTAKAKYPINFRKL